MIDLDVWLFMKQKTLNALLLRCVKLFHLLTAMIRNHKTRPFSA